MCCLTQKLWIFCCLTYLSTMYAMYAFFAKPVRITIGNVEKWWASTLLVRILVWILVWILVPLYLWQKNSQQMSISIYVIKEYLLTFLPFQYLFVYFIRIKDNSFFIKLDIWFTKVQYTKTLPYFPKTSLFSCLFQGCVNKLYLASENARLSFS